MFSIIDSDLRPFSFARQEGFLQLSQHLIDIASEGRFTIRDYSPHPTTITTKLNGLKERIMEKLIKNFSELVSGVCVLDHWSNSMNKIKFIGIAIR